MVSEQRTLVREPTLLDAHLFSGTHLYRSMRLGLVYADSVPPKQPHKVTELERLSDEVFDSQPGEGGIDSLLAIGTGENHFQVGPQALGLFENLPA